MNLNELVWNDRYIYHFKNIKTLNIFDKINHFHLKKTTTLSK